MLKYVGNYESAPLSFGAKKTFSPKSKQTSLQDTQISSIQDNLEKTKLKIDILKSDLDSSRAELISARKNLSVIGKTTTFAKAKLKQIRVFINWKENDARFMFGNVNKIFKAKFKLAKAEANCQKSRLVGGNVKKAQKKVEKSQDKLDKIYRSNRYSIFADRKQANGLSIFKNILGFNNSLLVSNAKVQKNKLKKVILLLIATKKELERQYAQAKERVIAKEKELLNVQKQADALSTKLMMLLKTQATKVR